MTGLKRLTPPQSRKVNSLVKKECCNCDNGHCILLDDGEECVCPQLISYIETARRKAHDLKEYIDILFDWFKLNSNEFAMDINTVEAAELTRNILIDWIPIFEDRQIDYNIDIPEQPFRVKLDTDGYMRILNNLIQNVISHSHADKIEIFLSKQEKNMQIRLTDNGIGIEKEDLKHIFERLYKCDKGRAEKGSGLGLSIVHQLVEKMNGTITADSVPEKGTKFTLLFPLID